MRDHPRKVPRATPVIGVIFGAIFLVRALSFLGDLILKGCDIRVDKNGTVGEMMVAYAVVLFIFLAALALVILTGNSTRMRARRKSCPEIDVNGFENVPLDVPENDQSEARGIDRRPAREDQILDSNCPGPNLAEIRITSAGPHHAASASACRMLRGRRINGDNDGIVWQNGLSNGQLDDAEATSHKPLESRVQADISEQPGGRSYVFHARRNHRAHARVSTTTTHVLSEILDSAIRAYDAVHGEIFLVDEEGDLGLTSSYHPYTLAARACQSQDSLLWVGEEHAGDRALHGFEGARSILSLLLRHGEKTYGVLQVARSIWQRPFTVSDLRIGHRIAALAAEHISRVVVADEWRNLRMSAAREPG